MEDPQYHSLRHAVNAEVLTQGGNLEMITPGAYGGPTDRSTETL